jgi:hypothetical protein
MCPEAVGALQNVADQTDLATDVAELSRLIAAGELAEKITKENKATAKKLLLQGVDVPGFKIQEASGRSTIKADVVLSKLKSQGYADGVLWNSVSITKKKLEAVVGTKTLKSGKALKAEVDDVLDGAVVPGKPIQKLVHA